MKLAIISRKGGSGKTTLAINLAVATDWPVIDLDPQASAFIWCQRRQHPSPTVTIANAVSLPTVIESNFVIDTPPHQDSLALAAARAADACLMPLRPTQHDLDQLQAGADIAAMASKPLAIVLSQVHPTATHTDLIGELENLGLTVCPVLIRTRADYQAAFGEGLGVTETEGKARSEMEALRDWVCSWLES